MKKVRRLTALFLCILMMFPAQSMTIFADTAETLPAVSTEETTEPEPTEPEPAESETIGEETDAVERIEETLEVEALNSSDERIEESLPIEPLIVWNQDAMIYWNPGGELPAELASASNATKATASNATKATASNVKKGRDSADGMSPERPVKTLARALEQAEMLKEELGVETSEITIYAMSPMEITDGQLYILNAANIRIASWPGRSYDNDTVFYVNGGQLTLLNALLESGNQEDDPEETHLVTIHGGTLQLGQSVEINGQIVMDYRKVKDTGLWELASDSNTATRSNAAAKVFTDSNTERFNIDEYILNTDEESVELIEDTTSASTWCKAVIELIDGYEDNNGEFLLDVRTDSSSQQIELVRTLYADEISGEEFQDYFIVTWNDETGAEWSLTAEMTETAEIRDTASEDTALYRSLSRMLTPSESSLLNVATAKSLVATRLVSSTVKYWNPGGEMSVSGETYPAGNDDIYDGNTPYAPYRTWDKAVKEANGGTIICMQSVMLGFGADEFIPSNYVIESRDSATIVTLMVWEALPQPAFIVPAGETLVLKNIVLSGIYRDGAAVNTRTVLCEQGDILIEENVTAETGYIQVNVFSGLASHPVTVNSIENLEDGIITLFFGGISASLGYRYTDVVVPGTALEAMISSGEKTAEEVGEALLDRVVLETANRATVYGGQSNFDWTLRQDTAEDDNVAYPQNLELYVDYYFDAIYLDGDQGDDNNTGATCQYPVQTWQAAYVIWKREIIRSIDKRISAWSEGMTPEYIEANYPYPAVIYICGTVTVNDSQTWNLDTDSILGTKTDYNGDRPTTEVRSHVDIPYDDNGAPIHQIPNTLVKVGSSGELTIKDVIFRNYTDDKTSTTLYVEGAGRLTVTGSTRLSGERLESVDTLTPYQEVTKGTHVFVASGGTFVMDEYWVGAIECRGRGVEGSGVNANITMNGGAIQKNNSYDEELFEAKDTNQEIGAGVVLNNKASFVMNGGEITQNIVYQSGAGVHMTGDGTSFTMNKGKISDNKMAGYLSYYEAGSSASSDVHGYGIGIYAGENTVLSLGCSTSTTADALVTGNVGYWADGIGVWTDGTLNIKNAAISDNYNIAGGFTANVRNGLGLYAGSNATVTMDGAAITGNRSDTTEMYGNAQGAGIYFAYNTNGNTIDKSRITGNFVGYEYSDNMTYSAGGGIYMVGGKLDITDSMIEGNEALYGAGIMAYSLTESLDLKVSVDSGLSSISGNTARYYQSADIGKGYGGGIYAYGKGTIELETGTELNNNVSYGNGGGMHLTGIGYSNANRLTLTMKDVKVNQNKSYSSGAGIYAYYYTTINATDVGFKTNISNGGGGAIYVETNNRDNTYSNRYSKLYFTNVNIESNEAGSGGGIYSRFSSSMYFNNVDINDNKALSGSGGGIYTGTGVSQLYFNNTNIERNTASSDGGGISCYSSYSDSQVYFLGVTIKDNTATTGNGGGCYLTCGKHYWTNTEISNNHADNGKGGGVYLSYEYDYDSPEFYLNEKSSGLSSLTENTASEGGGIFSVSAEVHLQTDGEYQNTATVQGSNLYLNSGNNYIYTGAFRQPSSQISGVYNIYLNVTSATTHALCIDPQSVEIDKKTGSDPDAIYLNTTNSFLSYISEPTSGELPIDVNQEIFQSGSVVVKPANLSNAVKPLVYVHTTGYAEKYNNETISYTALTDATGNVSYSSGGTLPRRTQLGGYNKNIILLGQGVYLSSSGNDNNDGLSPDKAVATFAVAKKRLEDNITATESAEASKPENERSGFCPFIFICGNVQISGTETWVLNYDETLYSDTNKYYKIAEEDRAGEKAYEAQIRRFASFVSEPMISVASGAAFTTEKIIINGMANAVVIGDQNDFSPVIKVNNGAAATLTGNSRITNNYYSGVDVYGELILNGNSMDENKQLLDHHGSYVRIMADNARVEMDGYSQIVAEEDVTRIGSIDCIGIYSTYQYTNIWMKGNSSIRNFSNGTITGSLLSNGIYFAGQNSTLSMQGSSEIQILSELNSSQVAGIYVDGSSATINMENDARLNNGINRGIYLSDKAVSSKVCMKDSSRIIGNGSDTGIDCRSYGVSFEMADTTLIQDTNIGISIASTTDTSAETTLTMDDDSRITNNRIGVYTYQINNPMKIIMKGNTAIDQNQYGICESDSTSTSTIYGLSRLDLVMEDKSRISGNSQYGINLTGNQTFGTSGYHNITMNDYAVIGGDDPYDANEPASGNKYSGIYVNSPINLVMNGESKISGNGFDPADSNQKFAITLIPYTSNQSDQRAGSATITLNGKASICNNAGGIYASTNSTYPKNPCEIILDGTGTVNEPSIQNNQDAVYLMGTDQIIKLQGTAILGASAADVEGEALALDCYGSVELDGTSQINGLTYLRTASLPITMTAEVTDPLRVYRLWLVEGFLGQVVVRPGGTITDVSGELSHFIKAGADGAAKAEDRILEGVGTNIILTGDNNVFLSGSGSDTNSGNSPSTAVRTFKRAKDLLEGDGYFTRGANIIICGSAVQVLAEDADWSFDSNGEVTNSQSKDSWQPLVIRYDSYTEGRLIELPAGTSAIYADTVSFKNITIDGGSGGSEDITATTDSSELLFVGYGRIATLGGGAVLQNNTSNTYANQSSVGVLVYGGTLNIEGGIIQNMIRTSTTADTDLYYMSSAIYCYPYSAVYPGTVTMKSGSIINNKIDMSSKPGNLRAGAISMESLENGQSAVFELSGGIIASNQVITQSGHTTVYGAGLVSYNAETTISGGIIRGNAGVQGSAIYYYDESGTGSMILSGGQINGNTTNESGKSSIGSYCPIYVAGWNFQLSGGGTNIQDSIYLHSTNNIVTVSGNITQTGREYHLFLNQAESFSDTTKFQKGSAVVQPDGNWVTDATPYLSYFQVHSNPYILDIGRTSRTTGTVSGITERQCLILMQAVFLDSENGYNGNDGNTPGTAVSTFSKAKEVGSDGFGSGEVKEYYVIYISGKAINDNAETTWSMPDPAYMSRYTGFQIYNTDGSNSEEFPAYHGYLIEPSTNLVLDGITVYGRRSIDTIIINGESLVHVKDGITVTVEGDVSTAFGRNYNQGEYYNPVIESTDNLSSQGGAFHVEAGGELHLLGGSISDTVASFGSAIYLGADATKFGRLILSGSPAIAGSVYLSGTGTSAAYIEPDGQYLPDTALDIVIENDYNQRPVVLYTDGTTPGYIEKGYYNMEDSIKALYDVVNNDSNNSLMELEIRRAIYLDGQSGNDNNDGSVPEKAFKTIKRVYEEIADGAETEGTQVYVVDTVEFDSSTPAITLNNIRIQDTDGTTSYMGSYDDGSGTPIDISGQIYFMRYDKPTGYSSEDQDYDGYGKETLMDSLFLIKDGGDLTLNGIYLDGHSQACYSSDKLMASAGVIATSPLVTVENGGILTCGLQDTTNIENGVDTATVFRNNVNKKEKSNVIGYMDQSRIIEGSSAGIELLGGGGGDDEAPVGSTNGGKAVLQRTQFTNLSLQGDEIFGGTDVYSFGDLHLSDLTFFSGTVFLEGLGMPKQNDTYLTSHYLTVDLYGEPAQTDFQVLMRDPYAGRTVVYYAPKDDTGNPNGPVDTQVGRFLLEERVKEFFYLGKRVGAPYVFELQVPVAVYIDGVEGRDELDDLTAGSNPKNPVKTLKRAFDLLYTRSGHTIYVVGPIQIEDENTNVTGTTYSDSDGIKIALGSTDKIKITRYIQPDFARDGSTPQAEVEAAGYNVDDYQGVLMEVKNGAKASFGTNVYFDGHRQPKDDEEYPLEGIVTRDGQAKAPLIMVEKGGTLNLNAGTTLMDNDNIYNESSDVDGINGGVIYNSGTTIVDGALFENNSAIWGSGVYQDGTFTINSEPEKLAGHEFYLTSENTGTENNQVWTDRIIQTNVAIPDGQTFNVEMDHAVKGRDVVKFLDSSAYDPDKGVDAEHDHFIPGITVPNYLFLVEAEDDETVLELQNWEVLDVQVPEDIYLVIHRNGTLDTTTKLSSVQEGAAGTDLLTSPEYTITNNGQHDVKVSVISFENQNYAAGITHTQMTLVDEAMDVLGETDLYLAIQGMDSGDNGLTMAETSLKPYDNATVTEAPAVLGIIPTNYPNSTSGSFKFVGAVGTGFVDKYKDMSFPISKTRTEVQDYMDGTTSEGINARAKYAMKFKLEIDRPYGKENSTTSP